MESDIIIYQTLYNSFKTGNKTARNANKRYTK